MSDLDKRVDRLERASGGDGELPWLCVHGQADGTFRRGAPWRGDSDILTRAEVEELGGTHRLIIIWWTAEHDPCGDDPEVIRLRWPEDR